MCLWYMRSIFAPLRSGNSIRSSYWFPILHYTFITNIHLSTAQLKENTHFHSASYMHSVFPQALSHAFPVVFFIFCDGFTPKTATIFPHRPLVVAVSQAIELIFHVLAVGAFISAPFRSGNYVRSSLQTPTLHSTFIFCIHLSTAQHKYSFSHSIYSVPTVIHMPFSNPFPAVAFLPAASSPQKNRNLFFLINLI